MNPLEIRSTITLGTIFALRMLGLFMIIPVFSIYGQGYTSSTPLLIGVAVGIYGLAQAILQIPVSMLAERLPRKPIIIVGLLLFIVGGAVSAVATDIWQVILGRFLAGAGAISAVIMALLADVTREQTRSKAMAMMGFMIGGSIFTAFMIGPILVTKVGISGLFWLTSIAGVFAIGLVAVLPTPKRILSYSFIGNPNSSDNKKTHLSIKDTLKTAFQVPNLNYLYISVFTLHLLMTAIFVLIPISLQGMGISIADHSYIYIVTIFASFILALPMIVIAEAKRKMRAVFLFAMSCIAVGLIMIATAYNHMYMLVTGLAFFFLGFNLMEAMIPSWLSKQAPIPIKNTVMGVSSSSQFFGAFIGGTLGGVLLTQTTQTAWILCAIIACVVLIITFGISSPPYLTSLTVTLPSEGVESNNNTVSASHIESWHQNILSVLGVEDVVLLADEGIAYIKIDKKKFTEDTREYLASLINQPLDFKIK